MTARRKPRVFRCLRCGAVATVYDGRLPYSGGCPRSTIRHDWRLSF